MNNSNLLPNKFKQGSHSSRTFYILRHGETDLNRRGIVQGRGMNTDLNALGKQQAQAFYNAYKHIPFDKIYTSTLKRTHQTVDLFIEGGISWKQLEGLDELAWGIYEGKESDDASRRAFKLVTNSWTQGNLHKKFEQGESPLEVTKRQLTALEQLMEEEGASDHQNILICMHGRALRLFLCLLTETSLSQMDTFPHMNTSLYKISYDGFSFKIVDFNNLDHLKDL